MTFDDLGRRKKLDDPDLGVITYTPDAAGRVRRQISPNDRALNKSTTMDYDMLDRMTERRERSLESHWIYDLAPIKGIGKLNEAYTVDGNGVKDYRRIHTYDELGRPSKTTQVLADGNYTSTPGYDTWSRPSRHTYKRGTDTAKEFFLRFNEYGYRSSVERPGMVLAQVLKQDAANRITLTQLGNGLIESVTFNPYTGRMDTGMVKTGGNEVRLHEGYEYDPLGNVLVRNQQWDTSGFIEEFNYDELNRLWTSTVDGKPQKTFAYDAAGNITNKTGLNWYTYPKQGEGSVRPHAVKSITNIAGTFDYDDNGNLLSGAGRTISWTSFDMPLKITKGSSSSTFAYGTEHQRLKQTKGNGEITIYAGAQEVEKKDGVITVKTYWPNGIGLEIDKPNSDVGTQLNWTHTDRLGSPVAITDAAGNFAEKLEYDAWGKRRSTANHDATPDSLDGVVDNKGFTNHEMLDQLDLVHMNGRVYDPLVGRFISGDPIIQELNNGQSYNRYSYVANNPTNLTDPTGFSRCESSPSTGSHICGGGPSPQNFDDNTTPSSLASQAADAANPGGAGQGTTQNKSLQNNANAKQPSAGSGDLLQRLNNVRRATGDAPIVDPDQPEDPAEQHAVHRDHINGAGSAGGAPPQSTVNGGGSGRAGGVVPGRGAPAAEAAERPLVSTTNVSAGPVKPGQSGTYGQLKSQKKKYGETESLNMDHQPSFAAQVKAKETALGRPLKADELAKLKAETPAVASPTRVHQQTSPTYGGRNTPTRIAEDASNLEAAAARDKAVFDKAMESRK